MQDNEFISGSKLEEKPTKTARDVWEIEDMLIKEIVCDIPPEDQSPVPNGSRACVPYVLTYTAVAHIYICTYVVSVAPLLMNDTTETIYCHVRKYTSVRK